MTWRAGSVSDRSLLFLRSLTLPARRSTIKLRAVAMLRSASLASGVVLLIATRAAAGDPTAPLAARIDAQLAARQQAVGATPSPLADDAEFLRRVYLDLAGRIPSVAEARSFLDDPAADKRRRLVDQLLKDPRHVEHFTNIWRQLLIPELRGTPVYASTMRSLKSSISIAIGTRRIPPAPSSIALTPPYIAG